MFDLLAMYHRSARIVRDLCAESDDCSYDTGELTDRLVAEFGCSRESAEEVASWITSLVLRLNESQEKLADSASPGQLY
jgi:hypothetical protein